ncbi:MAG: DinB family protein [Saprospiraceae bacterium]|nr:DinB family protein [Saprospiraceae bacterium]
MNRSSYIFSLQNIIKAFRSNYFLYSIETRAYKSKPDKWSKRQILGHLIDSARYNLQRFTEIIHTEGIYVVKPYDQNKLVQLNDYQHTSDYNLITLWQLLNHNIITVLTTMDEHLLNKQIIIGNEPYTLDWLIKDYIDHLQHHFQQIFDKTPEGIQPLKVGLQDAIDSLKASDDNKFVSLLHFSDLEIEYYKPIKMDYQKPHLKDEVYVIASGYGSFFTQHQTVTVKAGDVLFVNAGEDHRFFDFSEDFATWVIFYGVKNQL